MTKPTEYHVETVHVFSASRSSFQLELEISRDEDSDEGLPNYDALIMWRTDIGVDDILSVAVEGKPLPRGCWPTGLKTFLYGDFRTHERFMECIAYYMIDEDVT